MSTCIACDNTKEVELPFMGDVEIFDCPCCVPWINGFSGYGYMVLGEWKWVIHPSLPNELALHHMQKKEKRKKDGVL